MNVVTVCDLLIQQLEKVIQMNGRLRNEALTKGESIQYDRLGKFSRRLNSLHSKTTVIRAELTDLWVHGCDAIAKDEDAIDAFLNDLEKEGEGQNDY